MSNKIDGLHKKTSLTQVPSTWINPSGEWRIGVLHPFILYPSKLVERVKEHRKQFLWDAKHKLAAAAALRDLQDFESKHCERPYLIFYYAYRPNIQSIIFSKLYAFAPRQTVQGRTGSASRSFSQFRKEIQRRGSQLRLRALQRRTTLEVTAPLSPLPYVHTQNSYFSELASTLPRSAI